MIKFLTRKNDDTYQIIRESIDTLPAGICFATPEGMPILTNRLMNYLVTELLGHTVMDAELTWQELSEGHVREGGFRLSNDPWLASILSGKTEFNDSDAEVSDPVTSQPLIYIFPSDRVWMFERTVLHDASETTVQILATDISDLYLSSRRLYEDNLRLEEQNRRQKEILENIVRINRDKELLATKAKVHDDIGHCLLATRIEIARDNFPENIPPLVSVWKAAMQSLTERTTADTSAKSMKEIIDSAALIGCRIETFGTLPDGKLSSLLLQAAIREALTNAVRHAGAACLYVSSTNTANGWNIEIWDNGHADVAGLFEGNGLSSLRERLEQEGASLKYDFSYGVKLLIHLPD